MLLPSVNGVTLPGLCQVIFGMGFPLAARLIVYEVDGSSSKTWSDGGKDVIFGSCKITGHFYTIVIVKKFTGNNKKTCLFTKLNTINDIRKLCQTARWIHIFSGHDVNNVIIPAWLQHIEPMQTRAFLITAQSSANFGGIYWWIVFHGKIHFRNLFSPRENKQLKKV